MGEIFTSSNDAFPSFDDIYWIDVKTNDGVHGDYLLANALVALNRLRCAQEEGLSNNGVIIGLDLIEFPIDLSLSQNLGDLASLVNEWPVFAFNFLGDVTEDEEVSALVQALERSKQIIPVVHGVFIFDKSEVSLSLGDDIRSFLEGKTESYTGPYADTFLNKNHGGCSAAGLTDTFNKVGDAVVDMPKITWLGVRQRSIQSFLNRMFYHGNAILPQDDLEKELENFSSEDQKSLLAYLHTSPLFDLSSGNKGVRFRFLRANILPLVRKRIVRQFEDEMERCHVTSLHIKPALSEGYWYFDIGRMLAHAADVYVTKLATTVGILLRSATFNKIAVSYKELDPVLEEFVTAALRMTGATSEEIDIVRIVRGQSPRLFPFDELKEDDHVLLFTDVINTGQTIDDAARVVTEHGAKVVKIFSFVVNSDKVTPENNYRYKSGDISLLYFLRRRLHVLQKKSRPMSRKPPESEPSETRVTDFLFFWELFQKDGHIDRQHYGMEKTLTYSHQATNLHKPEYRS